MRPIDDFQIRYRSEPEDVTNPIVAPQPTHPRLRDLPWGVEENVALFFRGRIVPHLRPAGERIEAQFKTEHGYLLLISECEGVWFFSKLRIWYVPSDLSGADCLSVNSWHQEEGKFQPIWLMYLAAACYFEGMGEQGQPPLQDVIVESESSLLFRVINRSWYRLSLF